MARLLLGVLALCAAGAWADPVGSVGNVDIHVVRERQQELLLLFNHIHEPLNIPRCKDIASTWNIERNLEHYSNITAAKIYVTMLENQWNLPRAVPFSFSVPEHTYEAMTLFHLLYSTKDYGTFYNTTVYLRDIVNEGLFVYVLNVVILYHPETQGLTIPPIYEVFPSFFNNGEIMNTAQRINTHGRHLVHNYPSTYLWDDNVVIRWNETLWPYYDTNNFNLAYYTNDFALNAMHYYFHVMFPQWLGCDVVPGLANERRGELWMFHYRELLSRYYLERLSNGLGEIPEITDVVEDGYLSGLLYHNGVAFPSRPNNYHLDHSSFVKEIEEITEYERRIWEAIDRGYVINNQGEHINILNDQGFVILGNMIEANADSLNFNYHKDFIRIWKTVLGNSVNRNPKYSNNYIPLVVPSALEHYQTAQRDPAFFMIVKRVMRLVEYWQRRVPLHKQEVLSFPAVNIQKVEVDRLVTFFEYSYMNVSNHLHLNEVERSGLYDDVSVLVQHPRLNHKPYNVRIHVKSDVAKTVLVRLFLGPKYDSRGVEIPLHENYRNFVSLDQFTYDIPVGDCVITRESTANRYTVKDWDSSHDILESINKGQWVPDMNQSVEKYPHHLLLPKGRVGGMPFQLMVYIQEYHAPKIPYGTGFDPNVSLGLGTGARHIVDVPLKFPLDRPLHIWQVKNLHNIWFQDVLIHHKHVPEIDVPHFE